MARAASTRIYEQGSLFGLLNAICFTVQVFAYSFEIAHSNPDRAKHIARSLDWKTKKLGKNFRLSDSVRAFDVLK